jgi:co-chaperonin GroES (HSP10)
MTYKPTWAAYEKDANDPNDANKALKASDMFVSERDKELKTSAKARQWEKDRKESIYKEKPQFIKKRIKVDEEKKIASLKGIKDLGVFDNSIKPMPGYLILDVEITQTETQTGIILPESQKEPNTGTVVEISDPLIVVSQDSIQSIPCPVKVGEKVLFKRMAGQMGSPGAELSINGKDFRLMRWSNDPQQSDLLGVFYE